MKLSVIVCTYRRPESLTLLMRCLNRQTAENCEALIVDGDGDGSARTQAIVSAEASKCNARVIPSPKGLTKQRNAGLRASKGEIVCFLDDDVTFEDDFLQTLVNVFDKEDMAGVGGLTAYDVVNYPQKVNMRWRLRRALRIVPSLEPGAISHLGASVPVSFFEPFAGCKPVGYFYGFCMAFRRTAIQGVWFDETLPTYGGEDRDFSLRVSHRWPLMLCGEWVIHHERTQQSRDSLVRRTFQTGYGAGRTFAKNRKNPIDFVLLGWSIVGEFLIDSVALAQRPCWEKAQMPFARIAGTLAGVMSDPPRDDRPMMPAPGVAK